MCMRKGEPTAGIEFYKLLYEDDAFSAKSLGKLCWQLADLKQNLLFI